MKQPQPDTPAQSGSAGRKTPAGNEPHGADTGQNRYGQNDAAKPSKETDGQKKYRESARDGDPASRTDSNPGSGHANEDESKQRQDRDANAKDIPKTG